MLSKRKILREIFNPKRQDLYTKNYKTSFKDIKEYLNKWEGILCSQIGRHTIVKKKTVPKWICRFNTILIKISTAFLFLFFSAKLDKHILRFIWRCRGSRRAKIIQKNNKIGGSHFLTSDFTTQTHTSVTQTGDHMHLWSHNFQHGAKTIPFEY